MQSAPDAKGNVARGPFRSAGPDGTSLLRVSGAKVDGVKGNPLFLVNHFEYDTEGENIDPAQPPVDLYALLPMTMNLAVLDQDPQTGKLTPVKLSNVDFSAVEGLWIPCRRFMDSLQRFHHAVDDAPGQRGIRTGCGRLRKNAVGADESLSRHGRQPRHRWRSQPISVRSSGRGDGQPRGFDQGGQALRDGPSSVRAGRRDGRP